MGRAQPRRRLDQGARGVDYAARLRTIDMRREGLPPPTTSCRSGSLGLGDRLGRRVPVEAKAPVDSHRATADLGPKRGRQAAR